jgi:hypothetical protein
MAGVHLWQVKGVDGMFQALSTDIEALFMTGPSVDLGSLGIELQNMQAHVTQEVRPTSDPRTEHIHTAVPRLKTPRMVTQDHLRRAAFCTEPGSMQAHAAVLLLALNVSATAFRETAAQSLTIWKHLDMARELPYPMHH